MVKLIIGLLITIIVVALLFMIYFLLCNRFQNYIIRIKEVDDKIDKLLHSKYDLLNKSIALFKGNIEVDNDIFENIIKLRSRKINNFELDTELENSYNQFNNLIEENKDKIKSDEIKKIDNDIKDINIKLISHKEYYNENVSCYNDLIEKIPTKFVAMIAHYEKRELFGKNDKNIEIDEDFKM